MTLILAFIRKGGITKVQLRGAAKLSQQIPGSTDPPYELVTLINPRQEAPPLFSVIMAAYYSPEGKLLESQRDFIAERRSHPILMARVEHTSRALQYLTKRLTYTST